MISSLVNIQFSWPPNGFAGIFFCLLEIFTCVCVSPLPYLLLLFRLIGWPFFFFAVSTNIMRYVRLWVYICYLFLIITNVHIIYSFSFFCMHNTKVEHFQFGQSNGHSIDGRTIWNGLHWLWPNGMYCWHSLWWTIMWLVPLQANRFRFAIWCDDRLIVEIFVKYRWELWWHEM